MYTRGQRQEEKAVSGMGCEGLKGASTTARCLNTKMKLAYKADPRSGGQSELVQ